MLKLIALTIGLTMAFSTGAFASMAHLKTFKAAYPNAGAISSCKLCHSTTPKLNPYGDAFAAAKHDYKAIEAMDSDGDGVKNIDEINKGTFPGDKDSH